MTHEALEGVRRLSQRLHPNVLDDYGLEVGGGLGDLAGKVWRIGLMGAACSRRNVLACLAAIDDVMRGSLEGAGQGRGVAAALVAYD